MQGVYETLRQRIVQGDLPTSTTLIETDLAADLGVSRTPIREALRRLEQDGLLERVNRGLQIRERTPTEILDIFEVRIVLEGTAARLAAERRSEMDLIRIRQRHVAMQEGRDRPAPELAELNRRFHQAVWAATGSASLQEMLDRLALQIIRHPFASYHRSERVDAACKEHASILDAIVDRDAEAARQAATEHMSAARDIRIIGWAAEPDTLPPG